MTEAEADMSTWSWLMAVFPIFCRPSLPLRMFHTVSLKVDVVGGLSAQNECSGDRFCRSER